MSSMSELASIVSRRDSAYEEAAAATAELRAETETLLETISELNSRGAADQFQLLCRSALIELRSAIIRSERSNVDLATKTITALAHSEQANTSTAKSQRSLISK